MLKLGVQEREPITLEVIRGWIPKGIIKGIETSAESIQKNQSFFQENGITAYLNESSSMTGMSDDDGIETIVERIRKDIAFAKEFKVPVLRHVLSRRDFTKKQVKLKVLKVIEKLNPILENANTVIAVENHMEMRSSEYLDILLAANSKRVGALLDIANAYHTDEDPVEITESFLPIVKCIHLKDMNSEGGNCALGEGRVNWAKIIPLLRKIKWDVFCTLELAYMPGKDPIKAHVRSFEFLKKNIPELMLMV